MERLAGIAVARLKISIKEFLEMTPVELQFALKELNLIREQEIEIERRMKLNTMRIGIWLLEYQNPYIKQGKQSKTPQDVVRFDWEPQKEQTVDEMKEFLLQFAESHNKKQK